MILTAQVGIPPAMITPLRMGLSIALSLALLGQSAAASDFSEMAEPAFARWAFLSPERWLEVSCVHYAAYASRTGKGVAPAQVLMLRSAVTDRLTTELGSRKWAEQTLKSTDYGPEGSDPDAEYADLGPACLGMLAAAQRGTLDAALAPLAGSPVKLPDIDTCLAYDSLAREADPPIQETMFNESNTAGGVTLRDLILGSDTPERTARLERIAAIKTTLPPVSHRRLEMIVGIGCIPAILAAMPDRPYTDDPPEDPPPAEIIDDE